MTKSSKVNANASRLFFNLNTQPLIAEPNQVLTSSRNIDQDLDYTLEAFVKHIVVNTVEFIEDPFKAGLEEPVSAKSIYPTLDLLYLSTIFVGDDPSLMRNQVLTSSSASIFILL